MKKTRGSGTEVKGSGNIEMEASPSDLGPLPSEELSDLTTPELLTSWTIEPGKVNRAEVAARVKGDPEATARSNQALDDLGYGDSVPMYRVIKLTDDGEIVPEELISATLDPSKVPTNINFLMQGKFSATTPTDIVLCVMMCQGTELLDICLHCRGILRRRLTRLLSKKALVKRR